MPEVTSAPRAYIRHLRQNRICASGGRAWWKLRGWDWSDFLANGIPVSKLLETGDPHAKAVAEKAMEEVRRGQG